MASAPCTPNYLPTINNRFSLPLFSPDISIALSLLPSIAPSLKTQAPEDMSKAVAYFLIATAILFFIVLSQLNLDGHKDRLINRRFGYKLLERAPTFDPIVTKIEREAEKKSQPEPTAATRGLSSTSSVSEVTETYQYLTSGGRLNTTLRLIILFPLLDREPKDGVVSFNELEAWITQRAVERLDYVTQAELESKDKNGDLSISFREYLPQFSDKDIGKRLISLQV